MTTTDTTTPAGGQVLDLLPATIRLWARSNDLDVAPSGRIPESIVAAYRKAHGHAPRPKPAPPAARPTADDLGAKIRLTQEQARTIERLQVQSREDLAKWDKQVTAQRDEIERLQREVESHRNQNAAHEADRAEWSTKVSDLRDRLAAAEVRADLPCPGTHCGQEAVCPADTPPTVVSTLSGPLPEEIIELLDAWHALFAKASEVDTAAGHTLAEVALPALVRETADQVHDLVRLLEGDTTR